MRIISNSALTAFAQRHPAAAEPLQAWRRIVESRQFANFAELRATFATIDKVGGFYVFDIGGNKFRVIAAVHFNTQIMYIRHVYTHKEYNSWKA